MLNAFGWVLFGMAVWGLCILMNALEHRFSPEKGTAAGSSWNMGQGSKRDRRRRQAEELATRDQEIAELRKRVETLEAIVTDRRYQWEQELQR